MEIALKMIKLNKALRLNDILIKAWKCLDKKGVAWLTRLFNRILLTRKMPKKLRKNILVTI